MNIAALFVDESGTYSGLHGVDVWGITRDARNYEGPHPVVAHPPCQLWGSFSFVNYKRWGEEHNRPGNDGGCFLSALQSVQRWGGVLEHPAFSHAWKTFKLPRPKPYQWAKVGGDWVCEVWQSAYGHMARKRTWLLYTGAQAPGAMRWERLQGTHQIGQRDRRGKDRNKPTISGKRASATPIAFRDALLSLACQSQGRSAPECALKIFRTVSS